ncbi:MAG: structural protein P5 [Bacteroidaceae bacterium]|nr:structural protein P5 [Bacteroidaceae bacterium]
MAKKVNKLPRGLRNCNPLNIRYVKGNTWLGCMGSDGAFCKFITMKYGLRAAFKLLSIYQTKHGKLSIASIIKRWAPENENNTIHYIKRVCNYMGAKPNDVFLFGEVVDKEMCCKMVAAMALVENGEDRLTTQQIHEAWDFTFGEKGGRHD